MQYSVVIPAYNAVETLSDAISSVLAQSVLPCEIIVVDDGSTDHTAALARSASDFVTVITQANTGCGGATTTGIKATRSNVIATLDADDIWLSEKMENQLQVLEEKPDVSMVFCAQRQFKHDDGDDGTGLVRMGLNRSSMVIRRRVFEKTGDIIDLPGNCGDLVDWLARAREFGFRSEELEEVLALRRIISTSMTYSNDPEYKKGYLEVAHRAMLRRRQLTDPSKS